MIWLEVDAHGLATMLTTPGETVVTSDHATVTRPGSYWQILKDYGWSVVVAILRAAGRRGSDQKLFAHAATTYVESLLDLVRYGVERLMRMSDKLPLEIGWNQVEGLAS